MRLDDAMGVVRRLVWVADLDHRRIAAINVVCQALEMSRAAPASAEGQDHALAEE